MCVCVCVRRGTQEKAEAIAAREEEEMGNAMKALENRTLESKREMDIMAALDEMRALKSRHAKVRHVIPVYVCLRACVSVGTQAKTRKGRVSVCLIMCTMRVGVGLLVLRARVL